MAPNYNLVKMQSFGHWLQERRKDAGMRQSDVAKRAGVSTSYISTLERGQKHSVTGAQLRPEPDKVEAIAKAVGGDVNEALALCGYASGKTVSRPHTAAEFIEALQSLGVDGIQFFDKPNLEELTAADFEEILNAVRLAVEITISRKRSNQ